MDADNIERHERTYQYGVRALAQVKRHQTSAEPMAYELWYQHVSGHDRKLSAEVRTRAARGRITDGDIRELHASYLSSLRVSDRISEIGAGTRQEVDSLLATVRSTLTSLSAMDDDLSAAAGRLTAADMSRSDLAPLLALAVETTRRICSANQALQGRLETSQASITSLQLALEAARGEALTDGLTGLSNRRAFDEQFALRFGRSVAEDLPLSLTMIDIDHFKTFNDRHGHPVGDQVIRLVGSCIKQRLEGLDMAARYGGEEFCIVGLARFAHEARKIADDIRRRIDGYEIVEQGTQRSLGKVTVSVGIATRLPKDTPLKLLQRADEQLYRAKRGGRNRIETDSSVQ